LVTKFGGQPTWIEEPQWPVSKATGEQMVFIGQIALAKELFGAIPGRMAYLFMTDNDKVDGTWEPEGGENAIIIQPGGMAPPSKPMKEGPAVCKMVPALFGKRLVPKNCEFAVTLVEGDDCELPAPDQRTSLTAEEAENYVKLLEGNKIGGTPFFLQGDEYPSGGPWKFLLQLDSSKVPFFVNFGDCGIGYAFISEAGNSAKFLWQCS